MAGRKPALEGLEELLAYARAELHLGPDRPWRLISSRLKLEKMFFEVEELRPEGPRRIVGKVAQSVASQGAFAILEKLWKAGMRPPSSYCVCEPVAYFPERRLLLQERAPGEQLLDVVRSSPGSAPVIGRAADWLIALQQLAVPEAAEARDRNLDRPRTELPEALPAFAARIARLADCIAARLDSAIPPVPSHGDYHLMNIYVDTRRVTAIDVDTFALREPMADVAYFVAQAAIMGYHEFQAFAPTERVRTGFLDAYKRGAPGDFDAERMAVYVALAFLRSLHYDFCILRIDPRASVEPFLDAAEQSLAGNGIPLAA